ncbi:MULTISPECIES: aminodeoxychorismate synthase component I [unclassified Halomonas]|uniref:aminodeoxychorismate synthase component I n=1 Tax=unclassified Halomonas TaxID=2609666 RepID=UPI0006DAA3FF|nr:MULTISPECIES: aminodeoxychorismate synthase component I [unclassified Halomonas]KPQ29342.1 MAG: para-aminobenzoate synthetase aminase component PabB [Halomonas sp. HL-93]SBR47715.1 aminodeoxychorismate synthase, subunit I [Halomonas sp. HL-93]SNY99349.1 para-aminobenzoate synthetase component 1 [Halomonas sp. hl-4]SNY99362.1 aminodeoxychorismate synthase, subunit I [Halomonas sp. hl-4]
MTSAITLTALPYLPDPLTTFAALRQRPGAVLLDSGRPVANGRFDIMSSDPLAMLEIDVNGHSRVTSDQFDVPSDWPDAFAPQQWLLEQLPIPSQEMGELPFAGGLIGYWSYDLGREQQSIASQQPCVTTLPQARIGLYDWCITFDHHTQQAWLVASDERRAQVMRWLGHSVPVATPFCLTASFQAELSRADYHRRFHAVQDYIRAGDCYQINLAQRFSAPYQGDEWQAYLRLRHATPTPFSGFMAWHDKAVLSLSPERFIRCHEGQVETRPIKGTRPRGKTPEADRALAEELLNSRKDRAENVMIVDLLRNDLGRICLPGTIQVPQLCHLESYPNVHHLVSVIQGKLPDPRAALALLAAAFPGGSITGAPKIRAMQIIDELEPCQRSVYCGSLGYVDVRGSMDTSIAIRTMVADAGKLHVWGGGGLVADSQVDEEYTETQDKIRHLIGALE